MCGIIIEPFMDENLSTDGQLLSGTLKHSLFLSFIPAALHKHTVFPSPDVPGSKRLSRLLLGLSSVHFVLVQDTMFTI